MENTLSLKDKVAVITGAAQGIGKHIATHFVDHGATVVISDVNDELGEKTSAELGPAV